MDDQTPETRIERAGTWAVAHPIAAAAIGAIVAVALVTVLPANPGEDASNFEQALGVAIGAFFCLLLILACFRGYLDRSD